VIEDSISITTASLTSRHLEPAKSKRQSTSTWLHTSGLESTEEGGTALSEADGARLRLRGGIASPGVVFLGFLTLGMNERRKERTRKERKGKERKGKERG
jgi:hypothetical protein